jgi:hypothetical protein
MFSTRTRAICSWRTAAKERTGWWQPFWPTHSSGARPAAVAGTPGRIWRAAAVSHSCTCIGSPCLRHCVHGASIGGGDGAETVGACFNTTTTTAAAVIDTPCEWRCAQLQSVGVRQSNGLVNGLGLLNWHTQLAELRVMAPPPQGRNRAAPRRQRLRSEHRADGVDAVVRGRRRCVTIVRVRVEIMGLIITRTD